MSKITNDAGLTRSGTGSFMAAVPIWQQWASKVKFVHVQRVGTVNATVSEVAVLMFSCRRIG